MVINTSVNLFHYKRPPYGIANAPVILKKIIVTEGSTTTCVTLCFQPQHYLLRCFALKMFQSLKRNSAYWNIQKYYFLKHKIINLDRLIIVSVLPDGLGIEAFLKKVSWYLNSVSNSFTTAAPLNCFWRKNFKFKWDADQ